MTMIIKPSSLLTGFTALALLAVTAPAQAFDTFTFTTNSTYKVGQEKNDILLNSVVQNGKTITQFNTVSNAKIVKQNSDTSKTRGLLSTDCGDNISGCTSRELPSDVQVAEALGNLNLNKIIDGEEDLGNGILDVFFQKPSDSFYFFERGGIMGSADKAGNSSIKVQGLDAKGNLIGSQFSISKSMWVDAGYAIDTREIGGAQKVGSFGLSSKNGAIAGLRVTTDWSGADFKVIAASTKVPEPTTLFGLAAIGAFTMRRRKSAK